MKLIKCETCDGSGEYDDDSCGQCLGNGQVLIMGEGTRRGRHLGDNLIPLYAGMSS